MNHQHYKQAVDLFHEAVELDSEERKAFLDKACAHDPGLRRYVEQLLAEDTLEEDAFADSNLHVGRELLAEALGVASPQSLPEMVGRYHIIEKIGEGGMGSVYLAEQDHPRRRVALKMIRPGMVSPSLRKRFLFEAEVLGKLQHPGIAQIYDAGEIENDSGPQPYFAMEYIQGVEIRQYIKNNKLQVRSRLELVARIADGVRHAHLKGIVHRDLKPENVLVKEEAAPKTEGGDPEFVNLGQPKILDFGVARATDGDIQITTMQTEVGQLVGTLMYMSPEQVAGDSFQLDTRSDIYALGVLLYELLAERPPFDLKNKPIPEAARIIREEEPTRLGSVDTAFKGDIDTITCKALEKDRKRRYSSAAELASDIRRYLSNEPITAHPPSTFYQMKKFAQRHKGLVTGLALTLVVLIIGIISSLTFAVRALEGEKLAKNNEAKAERNAQLLSLTAAQAIGDKDPIGALSYLETIPLESRNWEWRHLDAYFNPLIKEFKGHILTGVLNTIARGPNKNLVAAFEREERIELNDLISGKTLSVYSVKGGLKNPCLAPNGAYLAAFSTEQDAVCIWNTETQETLDEIRLEGDVAGYFSPQGKQLFFGTPTCLKALEIETGRVETISNKEYGISRAGAVSSNGSRMVTSTEKQVLLYSLEEKKKITSKDLIGSSYLAVSPDNQRIAMGQSYGNLRLLNASTLDVIDNFQGHTHGVAALAFSRDGQYLASASYDGTIRVWDMARSAPLRTFPWNPKMIHPTSLAFSEDSALLAAGNSSLVQLWKWKDTVCPVLKGHSSFVYHTVFHPNGDLMASSQFSGQRVCLWDPLTGELATTLRFKDFIRFLGFTPDGARLIIISLNAGGRIDISLWDPFAARPITQPRSAEDKAFFKTEVRVLDDALDLYFRFAVGGSKATITDGELLTSNADGSIRSHLSEGWLHLYDIGKKETIRKLGKQKTKILATGFSPDGARLLSGDEQGLIKVWDTRSGALLSTLKTHHIAIYSISYSPDGSRFVSCGKDASIIVWDSNTFEQILVLRGHGVYVHSVAFSPDGTQLVSGSGDFTVRIWDSVPCAERHKQVQKKKALELQAQPLVDRLLTELKDPLDVADALRQDPSLNEDQRQAALWVLLKRGSGEK